MWVDDVRSCLKWECNFSEGKITKIFSDIDALAVSMSEKLLRVCRRHTRLSLEKRVLSYVRTMSLLTLNREEEGGSGGVDDLETRDADLASVEGSEILVQHLAFQFTLFVTGIYGDKD